MGDVGIILPAGGVANAFTSCCSNILFALPASERNIFLKLWQVFCLKTFVGRENEFYWYAKPRAYYSVFEICIPYQKKKFIVVRKKNFYLFFLFFSLPHAWRSYSFLFLARKKGPHQEIRFLDNQMDDTPCSHLNLICSSHKNGIFTFIESDNCYHKQKTLLI